jgi:hypothetical protein
MGNALDGVDRQQPRRQLFLPLLSLTSTQASGAARWPVGAHAEHRLGSVDDTTPGYRLDLLRLRFDHVELGVGDHDARCCARQFKGQSQNGTAR